MNIKLEYASFQDFANRLWPCLSEEGMWVPSDRSAGVGELVDFDVTLADGFRLFHGTGQVIGVGPGPKGAPSGPGMTVRFSQLDGPSRNLIQKVVSKHRGEGGQPFVLAVPATKVEVVGDDEEDRASRSLGPEDLVAPFPELEAEADWADGSEPELTSFLRPSGGATKLELEADSGGLPNLDFRAEPPSPVPAPASLDETPEPPPIEESSAESVPPPQDAAAEEAQPIEMPEPVPLVLDEELPAVEEPPPALTPLEDAFGEFEETVAETQVIESLLPDEVEPAQPDVAEVAAFFAPPDVEAVPSTVVPPDVEPYDGESVATDEFADDDFADDEFFGEAGKSSSLSKWLWALVGVVAIVAAFFFVQRFLGRSAEVESEPTAGAEISVVERPGGGSTESDDGLGGSTAALDGSQEEVPEGDGSAASGPEEVGSTVRGGSEGAGDSEGESAAAAPVAVDSPPAARPGADSAASEVMEGDTASSAASAASTASPTPAADLEELRLQRVTWREQDGNTVIRLWLDGVAPSEQLSTAEVAGGAPRLVLKIAGIAGATPRTPTTIGSAHVLQLRFGRHSPPTGPELHIVADLTDDAVEMVGPLVFDGTAVEFRLGRPSG